LTSREDLITTKAAAKAWFSPQFLAWYLAGLFKVGLPDG
jgi:hypothetical protein